MGREVTHLTLKSDDLELADIIGLADSTSPEDGLVNALWRAQQAVETGDLEAATVTVRIVPG